MNRNDEFNHLKSSINLSAYAAAQGYIINQRKTSRNSVQMEGPDHHQIVITMNGQGHWRYWTVGDRSNRGSIIDFVQKRKGLDFGNIRKELRPWAGQNPEPPKRLPKGSYVESLERITPDIEKVIEAYEAMRPIDGHHDYLENERGIPAEVLADPRFADKIRSDRYRNAVFPHYNRQGLCGYEMKNRAYNGFAKGGQKGLWASAARKDDQYLVIVEAAIDALSYHAVHRPEQTRYVSMGGAPNPEQPALIQSAIRHMSEGSAVIIATDNDEGGDYLCEDIQLWYHETRRSDIDVIEDRPLKRDRDWNDVLRNGEPLPLRPGVFSFPRVPNAKRRTS